MSQSTHHFDSLIKQAKVFNNNEIPVVQDIAIKDGIIVKRDAHIDPNLAAEVIDGEGLFAMPGMFDIHTHYDLELEIAPGLTESVRHGTTTVVISNCSLGLAFGAQREGNVDPIVDCYARVENMPKSVLRSCADKVNWDSPQEYLTHLDSLNLGTNVVTMIPHSMLRIHAMGFENSINRDPNETEMMTMQSELREGLRMGYAGFSTDALPFHYLANTPNCHKTIPTQFANYDELKKLTQVVREEGALWQATPPKDNPLQTLKTFMLTSGRFHGKPLKVTLVAALDIANNKSIIRQAKFLANVMNSKFVQGKFYLQALGARFKIWSDGLLTPIAEEIPELRALNEMDLEDSESRIKLMKDPQYQKAFTEMWMMGKQGWNLARLKRILRLEQYAFDRNIAQMSIDVCPFEPWQGLTFEKVMQRVLRVNAGGGKNLAQQEQEYIRANFSDVSDEASFVLQMFIQFDTQISWSTVTANRDIQTVRDLLMHPKLLPGFNDSGAHLTNMAFYDVNLRSLKLAYEGGEQDLSYMVKRLTKDAADVFGVKGGTINVGDVADLVLLNPQNLKAYQGEQQVQRVYREDFQHDQLVNRSDGVVPLVMVAGNTAWSNDTFSVSLGKKKFGRLLRAVNAKNIKPENPQITNSEASCSDNEASSAVA